MSFAALLPNMLRNVVVSLSALAGPYLASRSSGPGASIALALNSDGTGTITGSVFTTVNFNWATPTTTGIGSSYWVKYTETITLNNGSGGGSTSGDLAVSALSSTRTYTVTSDVLTNEIDSSLQIDIYSDAGGTQLVTTKTVVLKASRS